MIYATDIECCIKLYKFGRLLLLQGMRRLREDVALLPFVLNLDVANILLHQALHVSDIGFERE